MDTKHLVGKWSKRLLLTKISIPIILICAVVSLAVAGLSYYGMNVGNFVVSVEKTVKLGLALSETGEFGDNDAVSNLYAKGLENIADATYANIPEDIASVKGEANDNSDKRYMAYGFYLKNTSAVAVNYSVDIYIKEVKKNVDEALRVMVIANDETEIFAKRDKDGNVVSHLTGVPKPYETLPFYSAMTVMQKDGIKLESGGIKKYTVVMWLEGADPECTDDIKGGSIRLGMDFSAYKEK